MIAMSAKRRHVVFKKRLAAKMLEATRMGHTIAKQAGAINGESGLKLSVGVSMTCVPLTSRKRSTRVPVCYGSTL